MTPLLPHPRLLAGAALRTALRVCTPFVGVPLGTACLRTAAFRAALRAVGLASLALALACLFAPAPAAAAGDFSQLLKTAQATGTSPTPTSGS